jgi:hypothetical protein
MASVFIASPTAIEKGIWEILTGGLEVRLDRMNRIDGMEIVALIFEFRSLTSDR